MDRCVAGPTTLPDCGASASTWTAFPGGAPPGRRRKGAVLVLTGRTPRQTPAAVGPRATMSCRRSDLEIPRDSERSANLYRSRGAVERVRPVEARMGAIAAPRPRRRAGPAARRPDDPRDGAHARVQRPSPGVTGREARAPPTTVRLPGDEPPPRTPVAPRNAAPVPSHSLARPVPACARVLLPPAPPVAHASPPPDRGRRR